MRFAHSRSRLIFMTGWPKDVDGASGRVTMGSFWGLWGWWFAVRAGFSSRRRPSRPLGEQGHRGVGEDPGAVGGVGQADPLDVGVGTLAARPEQDGRDAPGR